MAPFIADSRFQDDETGLQLDAGSGGIVTRTRFRRNDVAVYPASATLADLGDLGNAESEDDGANELDCNGVNVLNDGATLVPAEGNWWGSDPPDPALIVGPVDYDPFLGGASPPDISDLRVGRTPGGSDVLLDGSDPGGPCELRVERSDRADTGFADLSGPLVLPEYTDEGATFDEAFWFYRVVGP